MPEVKWDKAALLSEAKKYSSRVKFINASRTAYQKMKLLYSEELDTIFPKITWGLENSIAKAKEYPNRSEFRRYASRPHDLLKTEFPDVYKSLFPDAPSHTYEESLAIASTFLTRKMFRDAHPREYRVILKNGDDGKSALSVLFPLVKDMSFDMLKEKASKYTNREQLARGDRQVYRQLSEKFVDGFNEFMPPKVRGKKK